MDVYACYFSEHSGSPSLHRLVPPRARSQLAQSRPNQRQAAHGRRGVFPASLQFALLDARRYLPLPRQICVGNVLQPGSGALSSRVAQVRAGIPHTVPLSTVNRQCSSGLQAVAHVAAGIKAGHYSVGIAAGEKLYGDAICCRKTRGWCVR